MQTLSSAFAAHLQGEVTTLATCWHIARRDGVAMFFTDHDADLVVDGQIYRATTGMAPSAVSSQLGLAVDNLEIEGLLSDDAITEDALLQGLYDHAALTIFMVNYADPTMGRLPVKTGWLGEVTVRDGVFVMEVRGLSAALQQQIGEVYTPTCRAQLGDGRCKLALAALTVSGTVDAVESVFAFSDAARTEADGHFTYGTITFTSGANAGRSMEIRDFNDGRFSLFLPLPAPVLAGDAYQAVAGCDKQAKTCRTRFGNLLNFRGEPHVPGSGRLFETSTTRSAE
jgi:uncharacterized phage protein (TIGR02218 family)